MRKKTGEISDFPTFYQNYERLIRGTLFHLVGRNDLDDLVQQTFMKCWTNRDQFEGRSKLSTWITSIALRLAYDHLRKHKNAKFIDLGKIAEAIDEKAIEFSLRVESAHVIQEALSHLSFEHRTVITLVYFQDLSLEEVSEATGEVLGTIKSRLYHAKKELGRLIVEMGIEI